MPSFPEGCQRTVAFPLGSRAEYLLGPRALKPALVPTDIRLGSTPTVHTLLKSGKHVSNPETSSPKKRDRPEAVFLNCKPDVVTPLVTTLGGFRLPLGEEFRVLSLALEVL